MSDLRIRPAVTGDFPAIRALLESCDLPISGVDPGGADFFVAEHREGLVGCAGLEGYGADGLLRSVAVAAQAQGRGWAVRSRLQSSARRSAGTCARSTR